MLEVILALVISWTNPAHSVVPRYPETSGAYATCDSIVGPLRNLDRIEITFALRYGQPTFIKSVDVRGREGLRDSTIIDIVEHGVLFFLPVTTAGVSACTATPLDINPPSLTVGDNVKRVIKIYDVQGRRMHDTKDKLKPGVYFYVDGPQIRKLIIP